MVKKIAMAVSLVAVAFLYSYADDSPSEKTITNVETPQQAVVTEAAQPILPDIEVPQPVMVNNEIPAGTIDRVEPQTRCSAGQHV